MIINIKKHRVQHGDIMNGISELMKEEKSDFIYTDPPWGNTMKYWHTLNFKQNGKITTPTQYDQFMDKFFSLIKYYAEDKIVIEFGQRWRGDIINLCKKYNLLHNDYAQGFYKSGSKFLPFDIHFISKKENFIIDESMKEICRKYYGLNLVQEIFNFYCPKNTKIVLDPFCGMGYTAQATIDRNMIFRGNEVNGKRLEKTIHRLAT